MDRKEAWVHFASSALTGLIASEGVIDAADMASLAKEYADYMVVEYDKWFDGE